MAVTFSFLRDGVLLEAELPLCLVAARIRGIETPSYLIGNRTCCPPACSRVPHATTLLRAPNDIRTKLKVKHCNAPEKREVQMVIWKSAE
jgi:hypothetical protein